MKEPLGFELWNPALQGAYRKGYAAGKAGNPVCPYQDKRKGVGQVTWSRSFINAWHEGFDAWRRENPPLSGFEKRWRCNHCWRISLEGELLSAPSPFDPEDTIVGCPHCKSAEGFSEICDEPGCSSEASCGFPDRGAPGVYRRTCSAHYKVADLARLTEENESLRKDD